MEVQFLPGTQGKWIAEKKLKEEGMTANPPRLHLGESAMEGEPRSPLWVAERKRGDNGPVVQR